MYSWEKLGGTGDTTSVGGFNDIQDYKLRDLPLSNAYTWSLDTSGTCSSRLTNSWSLHAGRMVFWLVAGGFPQSVLYHFPAYLKANVLGGVLHHGGWICLFFFIHGVTTLAPCYMYSLFSFKKIYDSKSVDGLGAYTFSFIWLVTINLGHYFYVFSIICKWLLMAFISLDRMFQ